MQIRNKKTKKKNPVTARINKLQAEAPRSWVKQISERTGYSPSYIRQIKDGTKGRDAALVVLKHLRDIVNERNREIEKLTA